MSKTVAIIGGGCSGALTAINLVQRTSSTPLTVYLIDPRGTFGPGLAYSPPSDRFKLNVRAKAMGAFPEDQEGFFRWLRSREPTTSPEDFTPRLRYGEYLSDLVEHAATSSGANTLIRVADEVTEVTYQPSNSTFMITLRNGPAQEVDACVVAVGNLMQTAVGGIRTPEIFRQPFLTSSYEDLAEQSDILIVGSSLTAVDVIMESEARGYTGRYVVVSRNGRLPLVHETFTTQPSISLPDAWETLGSSRELLKVVRAESRRLGSSQPVLDVMRPKIQTMWGALPPAEKRRFLRHLRSFWEIHRHRIPAEHATKLRILQESGRLTVIAGRITQASREGSAVLVAITPRGARMSAIKREFGVAFMCAGTEGDITRSGNPLIRSLLSSGLIAPGPLKLGCAPPTTPTQTSSPPIWVIGPLQREERWEITAVREIREEAVATAHAVTERLFRKGS